MTCSCPLCVEEAAATAAWKEHKGSLASFIRNPPPNVDPFASAEVRWAIRNMRRLREELPGFDRALREFGEVFSPRRGRGRPNEAPYMAVVAEEKLALREALMRALRSDRPTKKPLLWSRSAGHFKTAWGRWRRFPLSPAGGASVWLYEIENGRGFLPPQDDQTHARALVDRAIALVDSLRKTVRQGRRPRK